MVSRPGFANRWPWRGSGRAAGPPSSVRATGAGDRGGERVRAGDSDTEQALWPMVGQALYIGTVGYGGPTALDYLHRVFVTRRNWLSEDEFGQAVGLSQVLPGSLGVTAMSYAGHRRFGALGSMLLPLAFLAPSVVVVLALSWAYFAYGQLPFVAPLFVGLGALVVALLLNATLGLARATCVGGTARVARGLGIAIVAFVGSTALNAGVPVLVAISAVLGLLLLRDGAGTTAEADPPGVPAGAPSRRRHVAAVAVLLVLVAGLIALPVTRDLFLAFFQVGALAFGGGFASVAVLHHVAVDQAGWVDLAQFRDGIAMGQITPGPVLITATFIGYAVAGVPGALAATIAVFLPPVALIVALGDVLVRLTRLPLVRAAFAGLRFGFIGLVASVTLEFGLGSLHGWQTWVIFCASFAFVWLSRRSAGWAILATVLFSLVFLVPSG